MMETLKRGEKTRTNTAKRILNRLGSSRQNFKGYVQLDNGKICLTNGYILYVGDPVYNITELKNPPSFFDNIDSVIPKYNSPKHELDLKTVKSNLKKAKEEYKGEYYDTEKLCIKTNDACVVMKTDENENVYFISDQVIMLCNLIGGKNFTIQVGGKFQPCIIEGETGMGMITPLKIWKKEDY